MGEVEAAFQRDSDIAQCAVVATTEGDTEVETSLVAYVVLESNVQVDSLEIRERMARRLPSYMVPRSIVLLDALPQTPNGKLDRLSLPRPELEHVDQGVQQVTPRNKTEELLASIWCELLQIDHVGIHDRFFELGGHSLSATRVINRLESEMDFKLSLLYFFDHPTIAELSEHIESQIG